MRNKKTVLAGLLAIVVTACGAQTAVKKEATLKDALGDKFLIGTALNTRQSSGQDTNAVKVVKKHFNAIVAENCMKSEVLQPEEGRYDFRQADEFVKFGEDNGMTVTG
ncbi:endo-1,4-beta-xylanase, partial [Bacteroides heparinolyticus]